MKEAYFCSEVIFMEVTPFKSCANGDGIYCLLTTRIFAKMLKNRIKMGQYRWHLYCPRFLAPPVGLEPTTGQKPGSLCSLPLTLLPVSSELALASSATGGARARSS